VPKSTFVRTNSAVGLILGSAAVVVAVIFVAAVAVAVVAVVAVWWSFGWYWPCFGATGGGLACTL